MYSRCQVNDLFLFSFWLAFFFLFLLPFSCICIRLIVLHRSWSCVVCSPSTCQPFSIVLVRRSCALVCLLHCWCCSRESLRSVILTRGHLSAWSFLFPIRYSSTLGFFVSCGICSRCTRLHYDVILSYVISDGENVARISSDRLAELLYLKHIIEVFFGVARL